MCDCCVAGPRLLPNHQAPDGFPDHQGSPAVPGLRVATGSHGRCEAGLQ